MKLPDFSYETPLWEKGHTIIGIDEVGRGAFAGPVGVGGVIFEPQMSSASKKTLLDLGINDSKKLTAKKRKELSKYIKELALAFYVSLIPVGVINDVGIGKATFMGMKEVADSLVYNLQPKTYNLSPFLLIDAFVIPQYPVPQKGIVHGDSLSISIAAASIIAKVERDAYMEQLALDEPLYGFEKHKGYGTSYHRSMIASHGMGSQHRIDFCQNTLKAV